MQTTIYVHVHSYTYINVHSEAANACAIRMHGRGETANENYTYRVVFPRDCSHHLLFAASLLSCLWFLRFHLFIYMHTPMYCWLYYEKCKLTLFFYSFHWSITAIGMKVCTFTIFNIYYLYIKWDRGVLFIHSFFYCPFGFSIIWYSIELKIMSWKHSNRNWPINRSAMFVSLRIYVLSSRRIFNLYAYGAPNSHITQIYMMPMIFETCICLCVCASFGV